MNEDLTNPKLDDTIELLLKSKKQTRNFLRALSMTIFLDIVLTLSLGITAIRVQSNANRLSTQKRDSVVLCQSVNESNAIEEKLWNHLFDVIESSPTNTSTTIPQSDGTQDIHAQQVKQLTELEDFVNQSFQQKKC